ncbi:hypothetical protein B0T18DRAFT_440922 [Schizothecium vesticola]|uniref:SSCRP protein n=1 Tax=Schizothecium vesticola TaxID=314040 RepID=A0AA40EE19_9PEZI|nr:hypothetical protein B0T18DRAFT_440922 [Schizothecium vesticola]
MKSLTLLLLLPFTLATPLQERADPPQTVHLTFHGGPASYSLSFPADGVIRQTNNNIAVNIIDAPDYNALTSCTFYTSGEKALVGGVDPTTGAGQIIIGPPQPVTAVRCEGFCVPTYSDCYRNGQYVGACCNGFCAANKCRPWISPF